MVFAHRGAVVHSIETGHLIDAGRRHLQNACYLIHNANTGKAVLALAQVEQRHHGSFLVLRWVPPQNLGHYGLIFRRESEGYSGVVVECVAVLISVKMFPEFPRGLAIYIYIYIYGCILFSLLYLR